MLLPTDHIELRRGLNTWLQSKRVQPIVVGEFDDSALLFWFGQSGTGVFPAPTAMEKTIQRDLGVRLVGRATGVRQRFYAITLEAKLQHPGVTAICNAARKALSEAPG